MEVAIAGANGFVGTALARHLESLGHKVRRIIRSRDKSPGSFHWDPAKGEIDPVAIDGSDAVVNLAGASLADGRWTDARMRELRESRVVGTKFLAETIVAVNQKPSVFVCASGAGYYGTHPADWVDEESARGDGFLAGLCEEWEGAAAAAAGAGVRTVFLRMGVVIARDGGAIAKMLPVFRMGLGGPIGDGSMWMSWISMADLVRVFEKAISEPGISGPVNAVSPNPCTNREFAKELGRALGRPAAIRTPVAAVRMALGKMADETVLASARVRPAKLLAAGFDYGEPTLFDALAVLGGK